MPTPLTIRAFRANDEPAKRDEYLREFEQILVYYGVKKVTSQSNDWYQNPNTWLVVVESPESDKILGGARLQMAAENVPLPIEKAIGYKDAGIYKLINQYKVNGVGEFCGLWNSRKLAGMNIGSMFLGIASISIVTKIGMNTVLGLCAPSTRFNSFKLGFQINPNLGINGEFNYPKENLVATSLILENPLTLPTAEVKIRENILSLRESPNLQSLENTPRGKVLINYQL